MRRMRTVALTVVVLYVLLAAVVGACPDNLTSGNAAHPGHHGKPMHSPLCAWACQLSLSDLVHSAHPGQLLFKLFLSLTATLLFVHAFTSVAVRDARGPPSDLLLLDRSSRATV